MTRVPRSCQASWRPLLPLEMDSVISIHWYLVNFTPITFDFKSNVILLHIYWHTVHRWNDLLCRDLSTGLPGPVLDLRTISVSGLVQVLVYNVESIITPESFFHTCRDGSGRCMGLTCQLCTRDYRHLQSFYWKDKRLFEGPSRQTDSRKGVETWTPILVITSDTQAFLFYFYSIN